jgi:hypothetical protein
MQDRRHMRHVTGYLSSRVGGQSTNRDNPAYQNSGIWTTSIFPPPSYDHINDFANPTVNSPPPYDPAFVKNKQDGALSASYRPNQAQLETESTSTTATSTPLPPARPNRQNVQRQLRFQPSNQQPTLVVGDLNSSISTISNLNISSTQMPSSDGTNSQGTTDDSNELSTRQVKRLVKKEDNAAVVDSNTTSIKNELDDQKS